LRRLQLHLHLGRQRRINVIAREGAGDDQVHFLR
jgi:hypothetical protein